MVKKILYIDLDGVVANFDKAIYEKDSRLHKDGEITDYDERSKIVDEIVLNTENFFENLEPIDNSIETVKKLMNIFDVYFLSTAMWNVPASFTGKRIWVENHFGDDAKKRLILTHRKDLNMGDYLIDDRTKNGAGEFTGIHIHFGTHAFPDWDSVLNYLEKV